MSTLPSEGTPVLDAEALERLRGLGGESLVQRMIALFLEHAPERASAAVSALAAGHVEDVERAAHSLKSTAANLGTLRLRSLAERIERTAADHGDGLADLVAQIMASVEEAAHALQLERKDAT
jgi:HPt (histidine-containing phosphotransfer) domain-containing protein